MTNKAFAQKFDLLAKLMELHGESSYKIRAYANAYRNLRALSEPVQEMTLSELKSIKGVGDAIAAKIQELQREESMEILRRYQALTPKGVQDLLTIKGLGIKKIKQLWYELEITSPGELLYACTENRLTSLKGFGAKTQANVLETLRYYFQSKNKYHYATVEEVAENLLEDLEDILGESLALVGEMRRLMPVINNIEILIPLEREDAINAVFETDLLQLKKKEKYTYQAVTKEGGYPVILHLCNKAFWGIELFRKTGNAAFVSSLLQDSVLSDFEGLSEEEVFERLGLAYILPEMRDNLDFIDLAKENKLPKPIALEDIKGVIHTHSTYSDGSNTLKQMADAAQEEGYEYLAITDHSKSAFYANGLSVERVFQQFEEVIELNKSYDNFEVFKGIESDILYDGQLDYERAMLAQFDLIISSIHTTLKMDKLKATDRLIKAVQNPYTYILGHMTGRLLLSRAGYPVDHKAVIDACAEYKVAIELNAHPYRLDIDWEWIRYAIEKGVKISINPDAHSIEGIQDIRYGVLVARKAGLTAEQCLNTMPLDAFKEWLMNR